MQLKFNDQRGWGPTSAFEVKSMVISLTKDNKTKVAGYSNQKNIMFTINADQNHLKANNVYRTQIRFKNGETFEWKHISKIEPMLVSVTKIRNDTGELLTDVSDEQIARAIYYNSFEVCELTDEVFSDISSNDDNYKTRCQWVRYKTNMDFVYAAYLTLSQKKGSISKSIGELSISQTFSVPALDNMLKGFKTKLKRAEDALTGREHSVAIFVKAGNNYPYPERSMF